MERIREVLPFVESKLHISKNTRTDQHAEGVQQYLKYQTVREMMVLLLDGNSFTESTTRAVEKCWFGASKFYRQREARKRLDIVLETGGPLPSVKRQP